jgi:hypothetical protein
MKNVALHALRFCAISFLILIPWTACRDSLSTSPSDPTTNGSNPTDRPGGSESSPAAVDLTGFTCDDLEEVRVRFSDPGYIRGNEVAVYAAFLGAPPGDKFLRIYWDLENRPTNFQIFDTQEGEVRRDNDELFDIEELVEHTYDGLSRPTEFTVRVELVHEDGNTRLCARNRGITVQPGGPAPCASHPQWQPVDCTTTDWVWSSNRAFTTVQTANANVALWVGDQHTPIPNTCSLDGTGWVSKRTFVMSGCNTDWLHITSSTSFDCGGHDGDIVRRLVLGPNDCFDY